MIISERIFSLLDKKQMTQKEFSEQTEISQSTISDWKRKKTNPSADKILKICEVLDVTPYELLAENSVDMEEGMDCSFALNEEEEFVLGSYRKLESGQKKRLLGYLTALREIK